jgi:hypothetical protein
VASDFVSPKDFIYGLAKNAGLKVRRTSDIVQIARPRSPELGHGPQAAMTFSCRRWSDASYLFNLRFGAVDPMIEGVLENYVKHQIAPLTTKPKGPPWLALTIVTHSQQAEDAVYDDRAKAEFERYILDWFGRHPEFAGADIEAGLKAQVEASWRPKSLSEGFEHPDAMCRRIIVARDSYGWTFPANTELEDRLATVMFEVSRERFRAFADWWAAHQRT